MMKPLTTLKLFLLVLMVFTGSTGQGQEKINLAAGVGFPELLNLGLRFQLGQSQLGIYGGTIPVIENKVLSMGVDYYYHFRGFSDFSTRRPIYFKGGLNYSFLEETFNRYTYWILVPRIGKDFNFSSKMGISLEGGLYLVLSQSEVEIKPGGYSVWGGPWLPNIGPSFNLNLFYRI